MDECPPRRDLAAARALARDAAHGMRLVLCVAALLVGSCQRASGPAPIAYDRSPCAHCRMLISTPAFAAQIRTEDGDVLDFDDPGCLIVWRAAHPVSVREVWYHHVREDRWLAGSHASFVSVADSPMGFGLGAVDQGSLDSFDHSEARRRVELRETRATELR